MLPQVQEKTEELLEYSLHKLKEGRSQKLTMDDTVNALDATATASLPAVVRALGFTGAGTAAESIAGNRRLVSAIADGRMGALLSHCPWLVLLVCQQLPMLLVQLVEQR